MYWLMSNKETRICKAVSQFILKVSINVILDVLRLISYYVIYIFGEKHFVCLIPIKHLLLLLLYIITISQCRFFLQYEFSVINTVLIYMYVGY